jgi:hypothetical protein
MICCAELVFPINVSGHMLLVIKEEILFPRESIILDTSPIKSGSITWVLRPIVEKLLLKKEFKFKIISFVQVLIRFIRIEFSIGNTGLFK